jgi:hypothetical protein
MSVSAFDSTNDNLQKICDYITELRLLKDVPFSYLIPEEVMLPPESIRFFYLDENWLNAIMDGAISIGRDSSMDAENDMQHVGLIAQEAANRASYPRFMKMHVNHRRLERAAPTTSNLRTGLILRSELVSKWKGLEAFGYCKEEQLEILRMESLTKEILLCIFGGELTKFVISEPKTGLRFGAPDNTGMITLRDVSDNENFGNPIPGANIKLTEFMDANGRLRITELAKIMQQQIGSPVASPQLAFELIAVAKRAEFVKGN